MSRQLTSGVLGRRRIDADLKVYLNSLTTPLSGGHIGLLNTLVKDLKSGLGIANLSDAFDVMYIHANETSESGLKNLAKRAHDATLHGVSGVPEFTLLEGFKGGTPAQGKHIDSKYTPSIDASAYTLNSASFAVYYRTNTINTSFELMGCFESASTSVRLQIGRDNDFYNNYIVAINSGADIAASTDRLNGMYIGSRTAADLQKLFVNKAEKISETTNSNRLPDQNPLLLALLRNAPNGPDFFENDQISFSFLGRGLTAQEVNVITDTFEAYMDANGKGVIL